jgi:GalNAc5-diNAcBac-PP-undecaprenol beta-1,3-glucosyltransferase
MPSASVLIPTHEHAATLAYAVASVQRQTVDDIEILIVGDGVDAALRATARQLEADDRRIRFFDLAKGPRHGEMHRDWVLRQARGRIVCYQSDDDLWLPGHLEAMAAALEDADFVGAMHVNVDPDDRVRCHFFDLERPEFTEPWLTWTENGFGAWACNGFGLSFAAHRLDAYLRLPEGWTTTPSGLPSDQFMWHKFARQPWCRLRSVRWPVALHFPSPDRRDWAPERRAAELARWTKIIAGGDGLARIYRDILAEMGERLLAQSLNDMRVQALRQIADRAGAGSARTVKGASEMRSTPFRAIRRRRAMGSSRPPVTEAMA